MMSVLHHTFPFSSILLLIPYLALISDAFQAIKPSTPFSMSKSFLKGTFVSSGSLSHIDSRRQMAQLDVDVPDLTNIQLYGNTIRAPIKYVGPYPCLGLRFPLLTTSNQRQSQKNITGVSLDFMIDTAANLNVIQPVVAAELHLRAVTNQVLPGFTSSGRIDSDRVALNGGSNTFMLGDAQLEYFMNGDGAVVATPSYRSQMEFDHTFMTQLTASVVANVACPSAGLLSLAFLQVFGGGVDFYWGLSSGNNKAEIRTPTSLPSVTFYGDKSMDHIVLKDRVKVPLRRIPISQLLSIPLKVNDIPVMALLDTGSPITVLHPKLAKLANVETVMPTSRDQKLNPFSSVSNRFQEAQAASRGELLAIMGSDGKKVHLLKSKDPVHVTVSSSSVTEEKDIDFGSTSVYVGEFPGLTMMMQQQQPDGTASPDTSSVGVILGMDVLRQRPSMLLRAQDNEVWF